MQFVDDGITDNIRLPLGLQGLFLIFLFRFMHLSGWRKVVPTFLMRFLGSRAVCAVANVLPGKFWSLGIKAVRKITPRFAQE